MKTRIGNNSIFLVMALDRFTFPFSVRKIEGLHSRVNKVPEEEKTGL
jgi:hypothetical protein